jgi:hypothetical protein
LTRQSGGRSDAIGLRAPRACAESWRFLRSEPRFSRPRPVVTIPPSFGSPRRTAALTVRTQCPPRVLPASSWCRCDRIPCCNADASTASWS